jgi:hypothetical protein
MNGKPPKFTSTWKTIPNPQFDAKGIYRKELAPPFGWLKCSRFRVQGSMLDVLPITFVHSSPAPRTAFLLWALDSRL